MSGKYKCSRFAEVDNEVVFHKYICQIHSVKRDRTAAPAAPEYYPAHISAGVLYLLYKVECVRTVVGKLTIGVSERFARTKLTVNHGNLLSDGVISLVIDLITVVYACKSRPVICVLAIYEKRSFTCKSVGGVIYVDTANIYISIARIILHNVVCT